VAPAKAVKMSAVSTIGVMAWQIPWVDAARDALQWVVDEAQLALGGQAMRVDATTEATPLPGEPWSLQRSQTCLGC
jgi:hypothetical protein